jgi:uncharacterized protein YcgI (DUF1989 family)
MPEAGRVNVLEPATGAALPLERGELLRIEQLGNGQCVDLNVFTLADYKERFDAAVTRMMQGIRPSTGSTLWSNPPRNRPLLTIVADTVGRNDLLFPACSGFEYEYFAGFSAHTNCHDILAEALREYGLTPDDAHAPLNFWLEAGVDESGLLTSKPVSARRGDYVELLAQTDVLAVLSVCGDDLFGSSQFEMKPVGVSVSRAPDTVTAEWLVPEVARYRNQRMPLDFRIAGIKTRRDLQPDPAYEAEWLGYPVEVCDLVVEIPDDVADRVERLRQTGRFGESAGEVVRAVFFHWWKEMQVGGAISPAS